MRETFIDISRNEEYDVLENNCATAVQRTLETVGLKTYGNETIKIPSNPKLGESSYTVTIKNIRGFRPIIPSMSFRRIVSHNPQGIYIKRIKIK